LVFRVLVVAKGYEPQFVSVDPLEGKPMAIEVKSRPAPPDDRRRIVSGAVIGPDHEPLAGALVEPYGCKTEKRRWHGGMAGIDPLAVTDDQGRFEIATSGPVEALDLQVTVRAMATKNFPLVPSGAGANRLQLSQGATIRGRVLDHDRPVPGILVGLVLADRNHDKFNGLAQIGTDAEGRFSFSNAPADEDFFVYGIMSSVGPYGAVGPKRMHAADDGGQTDAGDLTVEPAYRITGRLALSDGKPVPAHTRVLFNRQDTRDTQSVEADASGGFSVDGIPSGIISISASVPGYRTSEKNRSLDRPNSRAMQGLVKGDIDGLIILFEPGTPKASGWPTSPVEQDAVIRSRERVQIEPPFGVRADLEAPAER
jgi:protocatechuate 3,4-dioxygenase beta subunit